MGWIQVRGGLNTASSKTDLSSHYCQLYGKLFTFSALSTQVFWEVWFISLSVYLHLPDFILPSVPDLLVFDWPICRDLTTTFSGFGKSTVWCPQFLSRLAAGLNSSSLLDLRAVWWGDGV